MEDTNNSCCEKQGSSSHTEQALGMVLDESTYRDYNNLVDSAKHFNCIDADKNGFLNPMELVDSDEALAANLYSDYKNIASSKKDGISPSDLENKLEKSLGNLSIEHDMSFECDDISIQAEAGKHDEAAAVTIHDKKNGTTVSFRDQSLEFTQDNNKQQVDGKEDDKDPCCDTESCEANGGEQNKDEDCCETEECCDTDECCD